MKRSELVRRTPLRRVSKVRARPREGSQRKRSLRTTEPCACPPDAVHSKHHQHQQAFELSPGARPRYADRARFPEYMLWVKSLPCLMRGVWGHCQGHVEADHAGSDRGMGRKAHDSTCIPMCQGHHAQRFPHAWSHLHRRAWLSAAVAYVQALARAKGVHVPDGAQGSDAQQMLSLRDAWAQLQQCTPRAT